MRSPEGDRVSVSAISAVVVGLFMTVEAVLRR